MKEIIALQEYTDKYISLYEGEIRNIEDRLANQLIEKGIVAEHTNEDSNKQEDNNDTTGIFLITDDDIIACADNNNTVRWLDVLEYVIKKKLGIMPASIAPKQILIRMTKKYPKLFYNGDDSNYFLLDGIYFMGEDTSAKMGVHVIYTVTGCYQGIQEETDSLVSFQINNTSYNFIQLKGTYHLVVREH